MHFRRRMLYSPFSSSRQAQLCEKCDHTLDFDENCALYPSCWRYFRHLNAISIAFHTPSAIHAVFGVESSPTVRKMRPFTRFWRKLSVISLLLEIFLRLNAICITFYTPNAIHAIFSAETRPTLYKMRPYSRFCRKLWVISVLLEIFRHLNAISIAFYTPNAIHAVFSVETSSTVS